MTLSRNILIFLLQSPGLLINIKKSVFQPCQKIEFLEIIVNSKEINLSLPKKKVTGVMEAISNLFSRDQVSIREISKLIGKLCYFAVAVLPAALYYSSSRKQQIL